jgi:hypothetical protein
VTHTSATISLDLSAQLTRQVGVGLSVPYRDLETSTSLAGGDRELRGFGDVTLTGLWLATAHDPASDVVPAYDVSFLLGVKLPTGDKSLDKFAGSMGEVVPLGSGTTDLLIGATFSIEAMKRVRLFDSLVVTIPLNDNKDRPPAPMILGFKSVLTVLNRLGVAASVTDSLDLYAALDVQWKDKAKGVGGDVGETVEWGTMGAVLELSGKASLEVSWRIAHELVSIGVSRRF